MACDFKIALNVSWNGFCISGIQGLIGVYLGIGPKNVCLTQHLGCPETVIMIRDVGVYAIEMRYFSGDPVTAWA